MREPAKGPIGRAAAVAEGVAAGVRRRQREREPRVLLYARPGEPRVLAPGAKGQDRILDLAEEMVAVAEEADVGSRRDRARARRVAQAEERESRRSAKGRGRDDAVRGDESGADVAEGER